MIDGGEGDTARLPQKREKNIAEPVIYLSRALLARNDKLFHPPFIIPDDDAGAEWGSKKV